ncbi:protein kinase [Nonomuraea sp. NPDC046802]|uniref:protein kinase domain-containing protein n=1 Tax=Nonomuraea sp. NPDC046802 TaxID=3154919 RepID=UPI0033C710B6
MASLRAEDPTRLGTYPLDGLLSETGVYAARSASGERVAIKVFRSEPAGLADELRRIRLPDAYHTVRILDAGVADGLPFAVMEYVDGETLRRVIAEAGPLRGAALHRLAIATMTALVALHQSGTVHGAFGPGEVMMGSDGPRMINAGLAQALAATEGGATRAVGTPAFMAPELFDGQAPAAAADVFAWAATVVFAATGQAPFEGGSMSATTNRILRDEPDLTMLDDHLRGVVADCLAKDPASRPPAADVLLRLVGHSLLTAAPAELAEISEPPRPQRRSWRFAALAVVGGLVVAVATAGTVYALRTRPSPATTTAVAAASTTRPPSVVTLSAQPTPSPPPSPAAGVGLPGMKATLYENPADTFRVAAYLFDDTVYLRAPGTNRFQAIEDKAEEISASPEGDWLALLDAGKLTVISRTGGERFTVDVGPTLRPAWARDGRRLLLTTAQGKAKDPYGVPVPTGFTIVDLATRKATAVDTDDETRQGRGQYTWLPDGSGVAITHQVGANFGMRIRDLTGRETRTLNWVGYSGGSRMFSPGGTLFETSCPSGGTMCVWDLAEGVRRAGVGLFYPNSEFWGWYDDNHLMVLDPRDEQCRLVAMDLRGRPQRLLMTVARKQYQDLRVAWARR